MTDASWKAYSGRCADPGSLPRLPARMSISQKLTASRSARLRLSHKCTRMIIGGIRTDGKVPFRHRPPTTSNVREIFALLFFHADVHSSEGERLGGGCPATLKGDAKCV